MRARISQVYRAVMWACCLSSLACATNPVTSTVWRPLSSDLVVTSNVTSSAAAGGYLGTKRARSRVECVSVCNSHPDCASVGFDPTSGDCYLQPDLSNNQTLPAHLGQVWAKVIQDTTCHIDDLRIPNGVVDWDHALTPSKGTVTCNKEFMKTKDDFSVTCISGGSWQKTGGCARHIWRYPGIRFFKQDNKLPLMRLKLMAGSSNVAWFVSVRPSTNVIGNSYFLNGAYRSQKEEIHDPFPMSVNTPFRIKVKATTSNTFEMYVDDILTLTRSQHQSLPASVITGVRIHGDVNVTRVDLWCHN